MEDGGSPSYSEDSFSAFIPFAGPDHNCFAHELRLNIEVPKYQGSHGAQALFWHPCQMDTGSTGLMISAIELGYTDKGQLQEFDTGTEYLSSSNKYYEGYWVPTKVHFPDGNVSAEVKILVVTSSAICNNFNRTTGNCDGQSEEIDFPPKICYMGVGFGRLSTEQPQGTVDKNPFLNIVEANDGMTVSTTDIRPGYVIMETGVWVGLNKRNTAVFNFTRLSALDVNQPSGLSKEWKGTTAFIDYHGHLNMQGTALFDTGITQSYLSAPVFKSKTGQHLADGDQYTIKIGNDAGSPLETLDMTVGDSANLLTPTYVSTRHREPAFINTGRFFYRCYDVLFDAQDGWLGLRKHEPCEPSETSQLLMRPR